MQGHESVAGWDVARPWRPSRVAGVGMAGFRSWGAGPVDVRAVPHPAVTLVLEFGDGPLVVDNGRGQRGSLVARLAFGAVQVRGENVECAQVRLSPVVAHAVLGAWAAEPDHAVVALDEMWGRDASRLGERLSESSSWQDRFALLFISSLSGKTASGQASLYNATKFGMRGFALALREDMRPHNVGVSWPQTLTLLLPAARAGTEDGLSKRSVGDRRFAGGGGCG